MTKNKKLKIVAVIPCRVESERLYAKQLQLVGKNPILQLVINQIKQSKIVKEVILAISKNSNNYPLINFAKKNKLKYILGNEKDVLKRLIIAAQSANANLILRVGSEDPFIYGEGIDFLINNHLAGNYDLSTFTNLPIGSQIEIVNLQALKTSHKMGKSRHRSEYSTMYIYENPEKFKILKLKPKKEVMKPKLRLTVDTPEDLIVARKIYGKLAHKNKPIPLKKIIKFLQKNKKILKINSHIPLKYMRKELI